MQKHPEYNPDGPTCLWSCYGGSNGAAQELANALGHPVTAPNGKVTIYSDGSNYARKVGLRLSRSCRMATFLGRFQELGDGPECPTMRTALGVLSESDRTAVASYLVAGVRLSAMPGFERDALDGTIIDLPASHLTDGENIWRQSLIHYVKKYGLGLPPSFVALALERGLPPKAIADQTRAQLIEWLHSLERS